MPICSRIAGAFAARGDGGHYDPVVDAATAPLRWALAGLKVADADIASKTFRIGNVRFVRELLVVDVHVTIAPEDPDQDALAAPPWSTLPWHLVALVEEAGGVLARRSLAPQYRVARSGPL
jgi:hypothetical protein